MEYLFLQVGNNENKYVKKEELYNEAKKYLNENIYKCELEKAVKSVKDECVDEVIMIVRELLYIWRYYKNLEGELDL